MLYRSITNAFFGFIFPSIVIVQFYLKTIHEGGKKAAELRSSLFFLLYITVQYSNERKLDG